MTGFAYRFDVGDRVLLSGPPPDIRDDHPVAPEFRGKLGSVTAQRRYAGGPAYTVRLDEDLTRLSVHGFITNNFLVAEEQVRSFVVTPDEVDDVLASIQTAIQNRTTA